MNRKRIIALGMFDGVHMGHRALIARARQIAKRELLRNGGVYVYQSSL